MQKSRCLSHKYLLILIASILFSAKAGFSQSAYLPYNYQLDQKFDADVYNIKTSLHTSLKPYLLDSVLSYRYDQLMRSGDDSTHQNRSWLHRIIFNQHLFDVKTNE